ncbi:MAG: hypothetical protein KGO94_03410 [Alphaproteobacteria bacterium]|nr:hypothetical protein [Alphaproteobacteria bacterium]
MEQDIIRPEKTTKSAGQAFSPFGCFLAASGVTLLTFCLVGAAAAASAWAVARLIGLPDIMLYAMLVVVMIPVICVTIWTAGRAWHVERRLAQGLDIDTPIFKLGYYLRKSS